MPAIQTQNDNLNYFQMKKTIIAVFILLFSLQSCKESDKKKDSAPVNKEISDLSIYNLPSKWTTQDGKVIDVMMISIRKEY